MVQLALERTVMVQKRFGYAAALRATHPGRPPVRTHR